MTTTVEQLINDAYYLSKVIAEGYATPSGTQVQRGLKRLNALLNVKSFDDKHIPYFQQYDFDTEVGKSEYPIEGLIRIETLTYNINTLRLPSLEIDRDAYFSAPRVDNVSTLPFTWHFERNYLGGTIYFYPIPDQIFPIRLWCKLALTNVTLNQDLEETYDQFYIEYLLYGLAKYLAEWNEISFSPEKTNQLAIYEKKIINVSPLDVKLQLVNPLSSAPGINWGFVNLYNGFMPPGG